MTVFKASSRVQGDKGCVTLTTEQLAQRWGMHPESVKRHVRSGALPVRPIIPSAKKWVFSLAAVESAEAATLLDQGAQTLGSIPIPLRHEMSVRP